MVLISLNGLRPGFLLDLRMHRAQAADVDDELLALRGEAIALEQPRGVRVRRVLENAVRADDQRRAFAGVDRLDRLAGFLDLEQVVFVAVGLHRALAERELLRRVGRRLHLHHLLLRELFEIRPAEIARHLEGRGHDGAAVARMRLDDLALPFRIEQIGEALRRVLRLHQVGVVADDAQADAEAREHAVGVLVLGRIVLRDVLRHERRQQAVALPDDEVRGVGGVHRIDRVDAAAVFLADALEHALGAGALDAHGDAGIFRLERLGDLLGERQVDRGVIDDLAFLLGRLDQRRRDGGRRRRRLHLRGGETEREPRRSPSARRAAKVLCAHGRPHTLKYCT